MDKPIDIERAWKDEEYRNSLTPEQIAKLPPNPSGDVELSEGELDEVSGGLLTACPTSVKPITRFTIAANTSDGVCGQI